jgi:hypothetical protein
MDRAIVYDAQLPQVTDILNTNKFNMYGLAFALQAILGSNTVVAGLPCTPTSPSASLQVVIGPGTIYSIDPADGTAYGDLGVDTTSLMKEGILAAAVNLTITPPGAVGFSQVYLVQVALEDVDTGLQVLNYINAANPSQPFQGPNNNEQSQFTVRQCQCVISLKAGIPATTGTQVTPAPDVGFTALYAITVPNGDTAITSNQIVLQTTAPFFPTLPAIPGDVQISAWTWCVDTGVANAMVASITPAISGLTPGLAILIKAAFGNTGGTGASTLNLNGLGVQPIHRANGAALQTGDYAAGQVVALVWDGSAFQTINFEGFTSATTNNNTFTINIPYAVDSGAVNAAVANFSPAVTSLTAGLTVEVQIGAANTNTGAATLQCNATAATPITKLGQPLAARALVGNQVAMFIYDGSAFELVTQRNAYVSWDVASPQPGDLSMAVGDQFNIAFENVTAIPLQVATVPGIYTIDFNVYQSNNTDLDLMLLPNNIPFTTGCKFHSWFHGGSNEGTAAPPFIGLTPISLDFDFGFSDRFGFHGFHSDDRVGDNVNAINGFTALLTCMTFTVQKHVRHHIGCRGGGSHGHSTWEDTITSIPWTSLGTLQVARDGGGRDKDHHWDGAQATISGIVIVKRLA